MNFRAIKVIRGSEICSFLSILAAILKIYNDDEHGVIVLNAKHWMNEWTEAVDDDKSPIDQNSIFGVL